VYVPRAGASVRPRERLLDADDALARSRLPPPVRLHAFWVEDKTHGQPAYLDHLIAVHRQIQAELAK